MKGANFDAMPFEEYSYSRRARMAKRSESSLETRLRAAHARIAELSALVEAKSVDGNASLRREIRLRSLFVSNIVGFVGVDRRGAITLANRYVLDLVGHRRDDLPLAWERIAAEGSCERDHEQIRQMLQAGRGASWETELRHPRGTQVPVLVGLAPEGSSRRKLIGLVLDLTERETTQRKIQAYQARLRDLAVRITSLEEQDRRRIGAEVHESIGQRLAMARVKLGEIHSELDAPQAAAVDEVRHLLEGIIDTTRALNVELSSPVLYELGFAAGLQDLGERLETRTGIVVGFRIEPGWHDPEPAVGMVLFRAARELLRNLERHANATVASIILQRDRRWLVVRVEDYGVGFDLEHAQQRTDEVSGFGLFDVHEHLAQLGGKLEIETAPGRGTRAKIAVPSQPDPAPSA